MEIGIVGAGMGGVMASIAIARAGGKVTILEASSTLGEIGAGIQMVCAELLVLLTAGIDIFEDSQRIKTTHQIRRRQSHRQKS